MASDCLYDIVMLSYMDGCVMFECLSIICGFLAIVCIVGIVRGESQDGILECSLAFALLGVVLGVYGIYG